MSRMNTTVKNITAVAAKGTHTFTSIEQAIKAEHCNDSLHIVYPEKLKAAAALFLDHFNGHCLYAVKANPHPLVLQTLWDAGVHDFDVASLREIELIQGLFPQAQMHFMHPVKSRQAIRYAYAAGIRAFAFDHVDELKKIAEETNNASDLILMLRLDIATSGAAYALAGKFGAAIEAAPFLLQCARQMASSIGVCFHVGSQCMNPAAYDVAISAVADMLADTHIKIDVMDVGGGFPVDYPGMQPPPMHEYFNMIHESLRANGFADIEILCEPGRALVAEAGSLATRIELRKGGDLYLNDGTYGALFDAGTSEWPFSMTLIPGDDRACTDIKTSYRFFGPTCDSIDKMDGPFVLPADAREGDWIIFEHLGAYGYTLQSRFNGFYSESIVTIVPVAARKRGARVSHINA